MKNPTDFRKSVIDDLKTVTRRLKRDIDKVGKDVFSDVQERSRVRTGSFKSNWNFSTGSADRSFVDRRRIRQKSANLRLASSKKKTFRDKNTSGKPLFMHNESPYAGELDRKDDYMGRAEAKFNELMNELENK